MSYAKALSALTTALDSMSGIYFDTKRPRDEIADAILFALDGAVVTQESLLAAFLEHRLIADPQGGKQAVCSCGATEPFGFAGEPTAVRWWSHKVATAIAAHQSVYG